jgi:hypothetical protein
VGKFQWPDEIGGAGCIIMDDPTMWFDQSSGRLYLDYTEDFGYLVTVDVKHARVLSSFAPQTDGLFPGFLNMYSTPNSLLGRSSTVLLFFCCYAAIFRFSANVFVSRRDRDRNAGRLL